MVPLHASQPSGGQDSTLKDVHCGCIHNGSLVELALAQILTLIISATIIMTQ